MEKVCEAVLMEIDVEKFRKAMAEIDREEAREAMYIQNVHEAASSLFEAIGVDKDTVETAMAAKKKVEIDIDKVRKAASFHFEDLTKDQKEAARSFFQDMDKDKNGSISVEEFRNFLTLAGFETENCDWLFGEVDKNQNGTLDFKELVTFFYVLSRDEYKPLLTRAYTGRPDPKAENGHPTAGANDQGQGRNMHRYLGWYDKVKGQYRLGQWVNEDACSIV